MKKPKFFPLGENALTISFGNEISLEINDLVINLAEHFEQNPFPGFVETVPAYASLTIFYDFLKFQKKTFYSQTAFEQVKNLVENSIRKILIQNNKPRRQIEIPVNFDKEFALDLESVSKAKKLSTDEFLDIFVTKEYRVYMLGFLPGFAYMGELEEKIAAPRKSTPRKRVPKGSVGIAGKQTGIYPLESPGGWQIIGKTDVELFTPENENPTFLQIGDIVKFVPA